VFTGKPVFEFCTITSTKTSDVLERNTGDESACSGTDKLEEFGRAWDHKKHGDTINASHKLDFAGLIPLTVRLARCE
jgi:hypothetical protein